VRLVALAVAVNVLSYLDRVCISVAAPAMSRDLGLSKPDMGLVFGAFGLSYALMQVPWGAVADRLGARRIVALAIFGWSACTALTAVAWSLPLMIAVRLLFGALEAALSPAIAAAFARGVPEGARGTAFGAFLGGGRLGGVIAPFVGAWFLLRFGWRVMFLSFGALGLAVTWAWLALAPRDGTASARWKPGAGKVRLTVPLASLLAVAFAYTLMWQIYPTWFPTYLSESRGFDLARSGSYASLPFAFGLAANWTGGWLSDRLGRSLGVRRGRRWLGLAALGASAALLALGVAVPQRDASAVLMALAAGMGDLILGACWATAVDLGGAASGKVAGAMNLMSNLGGALSPGFVGFALGAGADWNVILLAAAGANILAALCWIGATAGGKRRPET